MMKHEFEERVGGEISDQNYEIIETVYTWHRQLTKSVEKIRSLLYTKPEACH